MSAGRGFDDRMDSELGRILRNERISPLFQPVADALEQQIVCYEVLSRGVYPLESPIDLFATAREAGLLWEAEEVARKVILRKVASLKEATNYRFYMNISPTVICDDRMSAEYFMGSLDEFSLGLEHIGLELTSPVCEAPRTFERKLNELCAAGITFSIDDFDPSEEGQLKLIELVKPVYAKLPRHLVHNLGRFNMGQQNIRRAMETLKKFDASLVAKGVEDTDELEILLSLGIRFVQGYLVARPESRPPEIQEDFESSALRAASVMLVSNRAGSDCPVGEVTEMPMVVEKGKMSCEELDHVFQHNQDIHHVVVVEQSKPVGIITRTSFYLNTGGRFGYSVFQRETVEAVAKSDPMITGDGVRVTEVSRAAMERSQDRIYEPVIVVDWSGDLVGTVTVKSLLDRTIEAERTNSGALDPLTGLPGNVSVRRKLIESIMLKSFNLLITNINGFRTFNLVHGFENGDRMIMLLADLVQKHIKTYLKDAFIGQMGYDRFAVVSFRPIPQECLDSICREFDRRSASLFYSWEEQERGRMELVTRSGTTAQFPLCTVSIAVTCSDNYATSDVSSALVLDTALTLLKKLSRECYTNESSAFVFDSRIRKVRAAEKDSTVGTAQPQT